MSMHGESAFGHTPIESASCTTSNADSVLDLTTCWQQGVIFCLPWSTQGGFWVHSIKEQGCTLTGSSDPKGMHIGEVETDYRSVFPEGANVNEGISPAHCTLTYTSVERVARAAHSLGPGALLAKTDVKSAYRLGTGISWGWNGRKLIMSMLCSHLVSTQQFFHISLADNFPNFKSNVIKNYLSQSCCIGFGTGYSTC